MTFYSLIEKKPCFFHCTLSQKVNGHRAFQSTEALEGTDLSETKTSIISIVSTGLEDTQLPFPLISDQTGIESNPVLSYRRTSFVSDAFLISICHGNYCTVAQEYKNAFLDSQYLVFPFIL